MKTLINTILGVSLFSLFSNVVIAQDIACPKTVDGTQHVFTIDGLNFGNIDSDHKGELTLARTLVDEIKSVISCHYKDKTSSNEILYVYYKSMGQVNTFSFKTPSNWLKSHYDNFICKSQSPCKLIYQKKV